MYNWNCDSHKSSNTAQIHQLILIAPLPLSIITPLRWHCVYLSAPPRVGVTIVINRGSTVDWQVGIEGLGKASTCGDATGRDGGGSIIVSLIGSTILCWCRMGGLHFNIRGLLEPHISTAYDLSNKLKIKSKHGGSTIGPKNNDKHSHLTGLIRINEISTIFSVN